MRILLVDDHTLVRAGIRRLLESLADIEVVAEASDAEQALVAVRQYLPDLVLLDLSLPGRSGFEVISELRRIRPETMIVIMSMHDDPDHVREALDRGAIGYVVKEAAPAELELALRAAATGQTFLSPKVSAQLLGPMLRQERVGIHALTPRQREILRALGRGKSSKEIAADLGISIKTVETHRARMMESLGCRRASDLLRTAMKLDNEFG